MAVVLRQIEFTEYSQVTGLPIRFRIVQTLPGLTARQVEDINSRGSTVARRWARQVFRPCREDLLYLARRFDLVVVHTSEK